MMRLLRAAALAAVLVVICTATLAPTGFRGGGAVPVSPLCVTCSRTWLADVISNVALFAPLGFLLVASRMRVRWSIALAAMFSLLIEILQSLGMPPGRTASLSDLIANSAGAAIGALIMAHSSRLLRPSTARARALVAAWSMTVLMSLGASAWAVARVGESAGPVAGMVPSALSHTPGYGWFSGVTEEVRVNGVPIDHRGSGPILLQMERTDTVRIATTERGRDEGGWTIPIVWIHAPNATSPHTLLSQRNRDVALQAGLHATRIGLATPRLRVRKVFSSDRRDSTTRVMIRALIVNGMWSIRAGPVADSAMLSEATLVLSPALGWSLIQAVVSNDSRVGPLFSAIWVLLWFLPCGWWASAALQQRVRQGEPSKLASAVGWRAVGAAVAWSLLLVLLVDGIAWSVGVRALSIGHSAGALAAGGIGGLISACLPAGLSTRDA